LASAASRRTSGSGIEIAALENTSTKEGRASIHGPIENVLVVGGGTAGWMTAVYLRRALGANVRITLVESKSIGTVGVGEATFNTIKTFFDYVGLDEQEWMPACNATYKMAIKFVNWNTAGRVFYHPFERYGSINGFNLPEWWLKTRRHSHPFDYACFATPLLCDRKRSPKHLDGTVFNERTAYPYAYHFDAGLLAQFLETVGIARGVDPVHGDVRAIALGERGEIAAVQLTDGRALRADLYIDCTGFRGLLINGALGEPFQSFSRSLFCDNAIAMRIPMNREVDGINPYTTATALSSGWVWDIPLFQRIGTGYVYASAFTDTGKAEAELRAHLGPRSKRIDAFHIKMRIGRNRNSWVKNCVSIGLASAFVEPLESTGIFFIQHAIVELVNHFPDKGFDEEVINSYNQAVAHCVDGVRDFLILHYHACDRADTDFWNAVKTDLVIPDELRERLKLWKKRLPNATTVNPRYHGFAPYSYCVMLLGLGYAPESHLPILNYLGTERVDEAFTLTEELGRQLADFLPSHYEYLRLLYGRSREHDSVTCLSAGAGSVLTDQSQ